MTAPVGVTSSRFSLESHDHAGNFIASLPYRNGQGEWMLGSAGAQLRIEIPYRGYAQVTRANLWEGKHELWLYDKQVSSSNPIFAGPIWDITAGSDSGVLAVSAQDPLSYIVKRLLRTTKSYSGTPEVAMADLMAYANGIRAWNLVTNTATTGTKNISTQYKAIDRNRIMDLLDAISQMGDGVDYYMRCVAGVHTLYLYGKKINPTALPYALEYGGALDGYSVQYNAQTIANDYDLVSSNGRVGNATDASKITEYNALYQVADSGSDLTSKAALNDAAATTFKDLKSSKTIPSIVTRTKTPIADFDFGAQFSVIINDWYVQLNQLIRVIGWQLSIGQGDKTTTVIYTKDTEGVT